MHEKGGIHLIAEMQYKYSVKQLYEMLEALDVYDTLTKLAAEKAKNNKQ